MTSRDRKSTDSLGSLITFAVAMDTCFYLELLVLSFQPSFLTVTFSARLKGLLFYLVPCPLWLQMSVHFLHCNRRLKHFCSLLAILLKLNTESKVHCCTSHRSHRSEAWPSSPQREPECSLGLEEAVAEKGCEEQRFGGRGGVQWQTTPCWGRTCRSCSCQGRGEGNHRPPSPPPWEICPCHLHWGREERWIQAVSAWIRFSVFFWYHLAKAGPVSLRKKKQEDGQVRNQLQVAFEINKAIKLLLFPSLNGNSSWEQAGMWFPIPVP